MDILKICEESNVILKSTFRNSSIPVDVVCNKCGERFPVAISASTKISCPACSLEDEVRILETIVKIDPYSEIEVDEVEVEKTKVSTSSKKYSNLYKG